MNAKKHKFPMALLLAAIWMVFPSVVLAQASDPSGANTFDSVPSGRPAKETIPSSKWAFEKHGGIVYSKVADQELKCDVYQPSGSGPFPTILMIHGGAWRSGNKLHLIRHAWAAAKRGFVVVVINYRHAPKAKFPAQIHDCKNAVRWIRANADRYQIDENRIGVFGYSAGGHLAALLGTTKPADQLEGAPASDLEGISTSVHAVAIGGAPCEFSWIGENSWTLTYLFGATRAAAPQRYERASPTHFVDHSENVPFRIFHGTHDWLVPLSTAQKFKKRLDDFGLDYEWEELDTGHVGAFSDFRCFDRTLTFFEQKLGRHASARKSDLGTSSARPTLPRK